MLVTPSVAQMVAGTDIPGFEATMGVQLKRSNPPYTAQYMNGSVKGNILWPGEQGSFDFQVVNNTDKPIEVTGKVDIIDYSTKGRPGNIWVPDMFKNGDVGSVPITVQLAPRKWQNITINPTIPARFGAYALVVDLGPYGRQFLTSLVRTFKPNPEAVLYPKLGCDVSDPDVLFRLGCHSIRYGIGYKPTTDKDFPAFLADLQTKMKALQDANVRVILEIGGGGFYVPEQPLGRPRPWLDDQGMMLKTKFDLAWLPSYDEDFTKFCKLIAGTLGYPRGPINAMKIWNEPWEGISISGWGADMLRFREITRAMAKGVMAARAEDKVNVLLGGADSSSNTFDKFFADGSDEFLQYLDFCSIHYQGPQPPSTIKQWVDRKGPDGKPARVKIWDTESWVANTDDRVAAVMATNMSFGYDRAVGVYGGNICSDKTQYMNFRRVYNADGKLMEIKPNLTWSVAASVGAAQHFLGERDFKEMLFKNGLPWVMVFNGDKNGKGRMNPEDGTIVVVGDIGEEYGADNLLFRTARGLKEQQHKLELKQQLAALPATATADERQKLQDAIDAPEVLSGATMTITANGNAFSLYDFYGNPVAAQNGKIVIPLDGRGYFLRGNGKKGSFAKLVKAVKASRIDGIEPLAKACHDFTAPIESKPTMRLTLTNVLNRPISGSFTITLGKLQIAYPQSLSFKANETKDVLVQVTGGVSTADNTYPLSLRFDAGKDGVSLHEELMHVNAIAKRTITVDGKLDDWQGTVPQNIIATGTGAPTLTEAAWLPFKQFDTSVQNGMASAFLAYDNNYFYFAAKIADNTTDPGMPRFETRNDDVYFYPDTSYAKGTDTQSASDFSVRWTGQVQAIEDGDYAFTTRSDDGVSLWVDGKHLVENWTGHGATDDSGFVTLKAGQRYDIKLEYFQGGGGATLQLFWTRPGHAREIIPTANLYPAATATAHGLSAEFFKGTDLKASNSQQTRIDPTVNYENWVGSDLKSANFGREEAPTVSYSWPKGVRHYSYRKGPELPAGNSPNHDNVQIAFNVLPAAAKPWYPCPPGTMPGYIGYKDTDYEYALNPVAEQYGGGTEIWRLQYPGMPHKHFYPRQPKSKFDGPVKDGKLVITRDANTRYVECAIPWSELPDVKTAIDAGKTIKFSYRVNNDKGGPCMELSKGRSVAKRNISFEVDWAEHWANELEFGAQK